MNRLAIAAGLGLIAGIAASVHYNGRGEGCGDRDYVYYSFDWRGRRLEIHIEDTA